MLCAGMCAGIVVAVLAAYSCRGAWLHGIIGLSSYTPWLDHSKQQTIGLAPTS